MKRHIAWLSVCVLAAAHPAGEDVRLRYRPFDARMSLTVRHDIVLRTDEPIEATRDFSLDLTIVPAAADSSVRVTIDRAEASSAAHGMTQRLGTRPIQGKSFDLAAASGGRRLEGDARSGERTIDLGAMVPAGVSVSDLLAGVLPQLPDGPVASGDTWTSEGVVRTLEGWAWAEGRLAGRHRVTDVRRDGAVILVSVSTEAEARLANAEGERRYTGSLKRSLRWTFDAMNGRPVSVSMTQESEGVSDLGGRDTKIHQRTSAELSLAEPGRAP